MTAPDGETEREGSSASAESKDAEEVVAWLEQAMIDGMDQVLNSPVVEGPRVPVEVETKTAKTWAG